MGKKGIRKWYVRKDVVPTEFEQKMMFYESRGYIVPSRRLIKTPEQIEGIKRSGIVNTGILDMLEHEMKAGITTEQVNQLVHEFTVSHGAIPATLNYEGYPKSVCVSINEVVCHGIPNPNVFLKEGDIVNVDVSTILDGYFSDASRMYCIGEISPEKQRLVDVTKECLNIGIEAAKPYGHIGDIGFAIEQHAKKNGYSVVRDLCGHGVGLEFHEEPQVNHFGRAKEGMILAPGMVFTIEPMINMGRKDVVFSKIDGWTVTTRDGLPSAQWEHTILMTENGPEILTH